MIHHIQLPEPQEPPLTGHLPLTDAPDAPDPITVTSRYLTRGGRPWFPVSGEFHFSRYPRERWGEELLKIKAGGVTVVASYLIWIHHEEREGVLRFDGDRDIRHFAELCALHGLDLIPRIGPWSHAEVRNGGFPDWLLAADGVPRTDDPGYLAPVRRWFTAIAEQLRGLDRAHGGPVVAIQIENELYDQPAHLATLKRLAQEAGLRAPLWTATAWGGVQLPGDELLPLYGGYPEAFWVGADDGWPDTCRKHFFFTHQRDDEGIGADLRPQLVRGAPPADTGHFPWATCELGGGMAVAYHRRPRVDAADIAALGLTKIGSGSVWQGYYMYHGGTNPPGELTTLQESHATGYPNDLPQLTYDFQAPLGEYGQYRPSYHELRLQHLLLAGFGDRLATSESTLPPGQPTGQDDRTTLRWAVRGDTRSGFLFVTNHQPYEPLPDHPEVSFDLGQLILPSSPVTIPSGAVFCWPYGLELAGLRLDWAIAQPVCEITHGARRTLVLAAVDGIAPELALDARTVAAVHAPSGTRTDTDGRILITGLRPGTDALVTVTTTDGDETGLLVLDAATARTAYQGHAWGTDRLVLCADGVVFDQGAVRVHSGAGLPSLAVLPAPAGPLTVTGAEVETSADGVLTRYTLRPHDIPTSTGKPLVTEMRPAGPAPRPVLNGTGRASVPSDEAFDAAAATYRVELPEEVLDHGADALLRLDWTGDIGRAYVGGRLVADQFFTGRPWEIGVDRLLAAGLREHGLTLRLLPLRADAPVCLPPDALPDFGGSPQTVRLHAAETVVTRGWTLEVG